MEARKPQWIALDHGNTDQRLFGRCSFYGFLFPFERHCHKHSCILLRRITAVTLCWLLPFPKTEQNTDFGDPARWKNAIVRRRLQFLAAVIDGEGQHVSERIGQEEEIYPTSAHRLAPRASESYASHGRLA